MGWIDEMPASERAELRDAGRIGNSRFDGPTAATVEHVICQCSACIYWRGYEETEQVCFAREMRDTGTSGHGPCNDPWGLGCICTGTAVDGECEACWMYLK